MIFFNVLLLYFLLGYVESHRYLDTSGQLLSRQKRLLVWEDGINWIQMIVGIGLPVEVDKNSITWGAVFKAWYLLPTNGSSVTIPSIDIPVRKRSTTTRWQLYSILQYFADSYGIGSVRSCLLRAICEVAATPFDQKSGLLSEILHVVLTPSSTDEIVEAHADFEYHAAEKLGSEGTGRCSLLFPECNTDLLARYTQALK